MTAFTPNTSNYEVSVSAATTSIKVAPTAKDLLYTSILVNGVNVVSGTQSADIPLTLGGITNISIQVTAGGRNDYRTFKNRQSIIKKLLQRNKR